MRQFRTGFRAAATSLAVAAVMSTTLAGVTAAHAAAPEGVVTSGSDWTVTRVAGGYQVALRLDEPLPVVNDAPTLAVNGTVIGGAQESANGLTLTAQTTDPAVEDASDVDLIWASSDTDKPADTPAQNDASPLVEDAAAGLTETEKKQGARALRTLGGADPAEHGSDTWDEAIYDFGPQSVSLAGIGGTRGEMTGKLWLPTSGSAHAVVVLLHGRHSACYVGTSASSSWPCEATGKLPIASYLGYEDTGEALASQGYAVVSISANAINANDNQKASDYGAQARGQLVLDTLQMLRQANAGQAVSLHDAYTDTTRTLDQALSGDIAAADLVGQLNLDQVGMMGHSRGGEGVTSATELNEALAEPFGIRSVLALAPVDFGRATAPDVDFLTILPYCDGDVSNQQGQHMYDDTRHAYDDNVLRSTLWVMGANHNFFNTEWTPGLVAAGGSDDWGATSADAVCGPVAETNIRLSASDEYDLGTASMSAWFRLTLGAEEQFLPLFTDSNPSFPSVPAADVRSITQSPTSARADIDTFTTLSSRVTVTGGATAAPCVNWTGRVTPQNYQYCSTTRTGSGSVPHWAPMRFGSDVPAAPMLKTSWTSASGQIRIAVPAGKRDASSYDELSVSMAPVESVTLGTNATLEVLDGAGHRYSELVSSLNPQAVKRMPASTSTTLDKIVLQQVSVPTSAIAAAGVDLSDVRQIRFVAGVGADATPAGGLYLSDLSWQSAALGTAGSYATVPTLSTLDTRVEEGNGIVSTQVAVALDRPSTKVVTGYTTVYSVAGGNTTNAMAKVTFEPGETCQVVSFDREADTVAGAAATTTWWTSTINVANAVKGSHGFGTITLREDDGTPTTTPLGVAGDPCEEYAARAVSGQLSGADDLRVGGPVTLTSTGFRAGEGVEVTFAGESLATVLADASGTATFTGVVPAETALGAASVTMVGAGSSYTTAAQGSVLADTAVTLTSSTPSLTHGSTVAMTATVAAEATGSVEFFDGERSLGIVPIVGGVAQGGFSDLAVGSHLIRAVYLGDGQHRSATSGEVSVTITKLTSGVALAASALTSPHGRAVTLTATVPSGVTGTVEFRRGSVVLGTAAVRSGKASIAVAPPVGRSVMTAAYRGNETTEAATSGALTLTVVKASASSIKVTAKKFAKGTRPTVTVRVGKLNNGAVATGSVAIKVGGKTVATVALRAAAQGVVTVKLPKRYSAAIKVAATFKPASPATVNSATSSAVKVSLKR